MTTALVAGLVAGFGIAMPVGAVGAYLVTLSARTSLRIGLSAALGVASADGLYALLAVLGGSVLADVVAPIAQPLRWASALVLVVLAARIAIVAVRTHRTGDVAPVARRVPPRPVRAYAGLLGATLVNPTTVVYFAALVVGSGAEVAATWSEQAAFVAAAFVASATWQSLLAGGGAALGYVLAGRRGRLVTALLSATVIALLAVRLGVAG